MQQSAPKCSQYTGHNITEGDDGAEPCGLDRRVECECAVGLFLVL
jgi:hypothetical protein